MLIPTVLKAVWGLELLFTGERKGTAVVQHYKSLVDRVLGKVPYFDINTLHQLHSKLLLALGRMKNETQPGLSPQGRITLVLQYWEAEKEDVEMEVGGKSEGDDTNADGQGRKLTLAETQQMARMRSHDLWGHFVRRWTLLTNMDAVTADYVELQLKAGLPYVRKQLYCQVNVAAAAGNPWKHLLDHRFANVKDFKQGQRYLGRVMMLQTDGLVPDCWEGCHSGRRQLSWSSSLVNIAFIG